MSRSDPTGGLLLGIGAGVFLFYKGFRQFREYKVVADTPRINIRSVPMGFVQIQGQAKPRETLTSPVSKTPCCFYRVSIDRWKSGDRGGGSWEHACTGADGYQFYLADATGRLLIGAHSAEYDLPQVSERVIDSQAHSSLTTSAGASDSDLLKYVNYAQMHRMGEAVSGWLEKRVDKKLDNHQALDPKKEQGLLAFKELLHAIPDVKKTGHLPTEALQRMIEAQGPLADPEREAHRQQALARLQTMGGTGLADVILQKMDEKPISGRYRLREYLVLPDQEYFVTGTCVENASGQDGSDRNMIVKGTNEPTFLISSKPTSQSVSTGLRSTAFKMVFGGAALTLVCLALLLVHLHLF